ncbi:MAG: signal peptide peptidase SppA [Alphaproteobacteria bacterium]|nr:signal peptide peptidase SppA [Alphaproteobacteria bacterium]
MKFVVRSFAILGFAVFAVSVTGWVIVLTHEKQHLPETIILSLDLTSNIPEAAEHNPIKAALGKSGALILKDAIAAIDYAKKDPRVKVLVGNFRENPVSMAGAQELRDAVYRFRERGKPSYAYATSFGEFGAADKAYYLASSFNEIWLQPLGLVGITGLAAQSPFVKEALEKIGAKADFVHREEYKSAMDMLTENDFTAANAEMLGSILDDLNAQMVDDIAADRQLQPVNLMRLIDVAPINAQTALDEKLITHIGYEDELQLRLDKLFGDKAEVVSAEDYLSMRRDELQNDDNDKKPVVAFIEATGEIVQSSEGPTKSGGIAADETVKAIHEAMDDEKVEAILLRIDSPGGSAVASETIRRGIEQAQNIGLPVIVSMGEMAGSGGYWMAAQADVIVADPATLTGSIGVIAGKVTGTDVLWDKLGIHWGIITRGENADMWTATAPFTDAQRAKVDALVDETYQQFKKHVAAARDLTDEEVAAVAKGRVWTGNQALNNGLVDELGGLVDAVNYTKSLLGIPEDDRIMLKQFPAPEGFAERLEKILEGFGGLGASMTKLNGLMQSFEAVVSPLQSVSSIKPGQAIMHNVDGLR